jgi:hypothetical protein
MTKVLYNQAVKNFILTVVNHVGEEPGAKILAVKSGVKFNQNRDVSHLASALARTPGDTLSLGGPNGTDLSNLKNKFLSPEKENHIIR